MKRLARGTICAVAVAGVIGMALSAGPALANGYTLNLSAHGDAVVGKPMLIQASGVNPPPDQYWTLSWIEMVTIPASVLPACPATGQEGMSVADGTGGQILEIAMRPNLDAVGNFSNTIGYTPPAPGKVLVCAYSDDGEGYTLARASLSLDVRGGSPTNVAAPTITRSGKKLVCNPGRWSDASSFAYSWQVEKKLRKASAADKLRVTRKLRGHRVRCRVRASNAAGATIAVSKPIRVR